MFTPYFGTEWFKTWLRGYNFALGTLAATTAWGYSTSLKFASGQMFFPDEWTKLGDTLNRACEAYGRVINKVPPDWSTNMLHGQKVVDESDNHILWLFHEGDADLPPLFISPPYAGRGGPVVMRQILALKEGLKKEGLDCSIYVFELKDVGAGNHALDWDGYFDLLVRCLKVIGRPVHLVGGCQGAWAAFILRCICPELTLPTYTNLVGPLVFDAGNAVIRENCERLGPDYFDMVVDCNGGMQPGWAQWLGFASMAPGYFFWDRYKDLFWALVELNINDNPKPLNKWIVEHSWMDGPKNLPGPWYKRVTRDLFIGNLLVQGLLKVKGKLVNLKDHAWRILTVAGRDDEITPWQQLDIRKYLPKGSSHKMVILPDHGHTKTLFSPQSMKLVIDHIKSALLQPKLLEAPAVL